MHTFRKLSLKLRHLEVFDALVKAGSISQAAKRLHLSQPAVSIALSNLEAEFGFKLFHRSKGYFALTSEALFLQNDLEQGLYAISRICQNANAVKTGTIGGVTIATNGALAINFLPKVIAKFQRSHLKVKIELRVNNIRQIAAWVSNHQIDIGLIDYPAPVAGVNAELFRMECVCIMRDDDPLSTHKVVHPELLYGRSVIGITGDHSVDHQLDQLLSKANTYVTRNLSGYYFAITRNMVAASGAIAIVDPINGKIDLSDGVIWRPFHPVIYQELGMITSTKQPLSRVAQIIHDQIREQLSIEGVLSDKLDGSVANP